MEARGLSHTDCVNTVLVQTMEGFFKLTGLSLYVALKGT